jgi:hypothetical protein
VEKKGKLAELVREAAEKASLERGFAEKSAEFAE